MSIHFHILRQRGLVYVRYSGVARVVDSFAAFMDYRNHPDFRLGQRHLVDLSRVTSFEKDFVRVLELQSLKAETFLGGAAETLMVYFAPTPATLKMARLAANAWSGTPSVVALVINAEAEALSILGCPETRISDLLAAEGITQGAAG